jgi:hypothetical protein
MSYSIALVRSLDLMEVFFLICNKSYAFHKAFRENVGMLLHAVSISLAELSYLISNI